MSLPENSPKTKCSETLQQRLPCIVSSPRHFGPRTPANCCIVCNEDLGERHLQHWTRAVPVSVYVPQHIPLAGRLQRHNGETTRTTPLPRRKSISRERILSPKARAYLS